MAHMESIQLQYNKALRYFLLTKYGNAATSCVKAISQLSQRQEGEYVDNLRLQLWLLYLNIATTALVTSNNDSNIGALTPRLAKQFGLPSNSIKSLEHFCLAIWHQLVDKSGVAVAGDTDPRLVCAYLAMTLKLSISTVGRQVAEQWFATLSESAIEYLSTIDAHQRHVDLIFWSSYLEIVDLYTTHILPQSEDFESARSFIEYNSFLTDDKKESLLNTIRDIQSDQQREVEKKKQLDQRRKEEAAEAAKEKERLHLQQQAERELQERKRTEAALARQQLQQRKEQQQAAESISPASPSLPPITTSTPSSSLSSRSTAKESASPKLLADQGLIMVKTWIQQLRTTGSAASVALLVIFFALLGLLRGPRGHLTRALRTIVTKLWQTAKMGTKVTYM